VSGPLTIGTTDNRTINEFFKRKLARTVLVLNSVEDLLVRNGVKKSQAYNDFVKIGNDMTKAIDKCKVLARQMILPNANKPVLRSEVSRLMKNFNKNAQSMFVILQNNTGVVKDQRLRAPPQPSVEMVSSDDDNSDAKKLARKTKLSMYLNGYVDFIHNLAYMGKQALQKNVQEVIKSKINETMHKLMQYYKRPTALNLEMLRTMFAKTAEFLENIVFTDAFLGMVAEKRVGPGQKNLDATIQDIVERYKAEYNKRINDVFKEFQRLVTTVEVMDVDSPVSSAKTKQTNDH